MRRVNHCNILIGLAYFLVTLPISAQEPIVKLGGQVPALKFKDIRYLERSLDDLPKKRAYVLVFTTTDCPIAQKYMPVIREMETEYRANLVQFVVLNVGIDDTVRDMAGFALRYAIEFPAVKDTGAFCAQTLGVTRTPEVVVLDAERVLRYRGRIDDQYRVSGSASGPRRQDLRAALEDVLADRTVQVATTPVDGCRITVPKAPEAPSTVTFAEHVAPLIRQHCVPCHRPGTAAPFVLTSYDTVAAHAEMIAEVVEDGRMPPWYGSAECTEFVNRRGLSFGERTTIVDWVRAGRARGNDSTLPPLESPPPEKWSIGTPDLTLTELQTHEIPATGVLPYQYAVLPYAFPRETWLQHVQIMPDNPRVVHHCNLAYLVPGEQFRAANFITGVVPGGEPMSLENGTALRIPKGATLVLQIHLVTTGKPEKCRISVGLGYAGGTVQKQLRHVRLDNGKFAIPPGAGAHAVSDQHVLDRDVFGVGLFCHMHVRGKDMTFLAHKPDGTTESLLSIPNYNFEWQHAYRWAPSTKRLPSGTRVECVAHYDNSAFNPYNPDPTATVKEGPQTFHEMMNGFFFFTDAHEQLNLTVDGKTGAATTVEPTP